MANKFNDFCPACNKGSEAVSWAFSHVSHEDDDSNEICKPGLSIQAFFQERGVHESEVESRLRGEDE